MEASISGVVRDAGTGTPVADYTVTTDVNTTWEDGVIVTSAATKTIRSVTDDQGRYKLSGLPAARYRVEAINSRRGGFESRVSKTIELSGHDLESVNFNVVEAGGITGKVLDENKEPVPGMTVVLVSREYYLGTLGYFLKSTSLTNDRGDYRLPSVPAGHPYLLVAEKRDFNLPAHSEAPLNPKLRKRVPMRTWYPSSDSKDGAVAVTVNPGERREGVDIQVRKSQSYCAEGVFETPHGPAVLYFEIEALQPSSGVSNGGGTFVRTPNGTTLNDGKFRICELYPGTYRLAALEQTPNLNELTPAFTAEVLTIVDQDLRNLRIPVVPSLALNGEVVWEGEAPREPISTKVGVSLQPLLRTMRQGESLSVRADIPGAFSLPNLLMDDFVVRGFLRLPGSYVKDITYGDRSVLHDRLRVGSAIGNSGMRVIMARDGATFSAQVADKDGNPVPAMRILILPASANSEAILADMLITGESDQLGRYTSRTLPPGKYYVAASDQAFDSTPESIGKLWRSRNRFKELVLEPNGKPQVTLEPAKFEQ